MKLLSAVMLAVVATMAGGCSIALQERPDRARPTGCSTSRTYPAVDTIAGATIMAVGAAALAYAWGRNHEALVLPASGAFFGGWVGVESGTSGYRMASECERISSPEVAGR